jgi:DNA topoisomerase II
MAQTCFTAGETQVVKAKQNKQPLGQSNVPNQHDGKSLEEIYQKKSQLEHILLRPDTYIGSTEKQQSLMWVHDGQKMVQQNISYVPGLYKIFDEILVNAADNKVRDATMDTIKIDIDVVGGKGLCMGRCNPLQLHMPTPCGLHMHMQAANTIQVWNNGFGIPVDIHKEEGVYVPELIFGHLLTSSNYDDNEKKVRLCCIILWWEPCQHEPAF